MKETSYQKKKRQLSESKQQVYELKRMIRDVVNGTAKHTDLMSIALEFDLNEQLDKCFWMGNKQGDT